MEWTTEFDTLLLQEVNFNEPFIYKPFARERGKIWETIANNQINLLLFKTG